MRGVGCEGESDQGIGGSFPVACTRDSSCVACVFDDCAQSGERASGGVASACVVVAASAREVVGSVSTVVAVEVARRGWSLLLVPQLDVRLSAEER